MSDMQIELGRALLKGLVNLKTQKNGITLEDVGAMFLEMAMTLQPVSKADREMHEEIARLAEHIEETKKEIFAISTNEKSEAVIIDASQHLDEVIKATEEATNAIMNAADAIQSAAGGIGGEKEQQIMDAAGKLYEACSFQDITGQRITKVIKLLENIEERVDKLNGIFGGGTAAPVAPIANGVMSEKDLLNGPQLNAQAASQTDIDALFASLGGKN